MIKVAEGMFKFIGVRDKEPVLIAECWRCFGGLIVFKKKASMHEAFAQIALMVWHIVPRKRARRLDSVGQRIISMMHQHKDLYTAEVMYRCGGNVDTPYNRKHYDTMKAKIEQPIRNVFPDIPVLGMEPTAQTAYSTIYFDEDQKVHIYEHNGEEVIERIPKEV